MKTCKTCKGKGRVIQMYQMGPGMYQQVQKNCDTCNGEGETIEANKRCKDCQGKKVVTKEKIIEVPLDRGSFHGHAIHLYGEGNELVPIFLLRPIPFQETSFSLISS